MTVADADKKFALKADAHSFLQEITYDEDAKVLSFIFKLVDGTTKAQEIYVGDLVDTYKAGDNIKIEGNMISFIGEIPSVEDFITIEDVNKALLDYAKKSDIPAVDAFITADDVVTALTDYVKKSEIPTKVSEL
jgi:hypothetical protein